MEEHLLIAIAGVIVLGIVAQWVAWRLHLPSILVLLVFGFVAGPLTHFIVPDELFGEILFPAVSLAVAIILFEGGMSLKISELRSIGGVLQRLVSLGALVTWVVSALAAHYLVGLDWELSALLGAILTVTGPTVIGPLLRFVRPTAQVSSLLKWEGIVIDPIGAVLAVLVFEVIEVTHVGDAASVVALVVGKTLLIGGLFGFAGAALLVIMMQRHWVPEFLHSPFALMVAAGAFAGSNVLQAESGLLTVTVMGVVLANQNRVSIRHILEFKENLRVVLIASLFIVLAARLRISDLAEIGWGGVWFLLVLVLVARPAAVFLSSMRSKLNFKEKLFISWMAPRGIVAAAVSSVFALRLTEEGFSEARLLVPLTFVVIIGTVALYGLSSRPVARWLGVSKADPQGVLLVGAHNWALQIAQVLKENGITTLLVDTNPEHIGAARERNLRAHYGDILSEDLKDDANLDGIGRLLALTPNDAINALAALSFAEIFGRTDVYQLCVDENAPVARSPIPIHLRGRALFADKVSFETIDTHFATGATLQTIKLTSQFDYSAYQKEFGKRAMSLFVISETGTLQVVSVDNPPAPRPGQTIIALISPK